MINAIFKGEEIYSGSLNSATDISYDNTISSLSAHTAQGAIDELSEKVGSGGQSKTWAEYQKMIIDGTIDNDAMYLVSGVSNGMTGAPIQMTKAEYTAYIALQGTDQLNTLFYVTDWNTGYTNAELGGYAVPASYAVQNINASKIVLSAGDLIDFYKTGSKVEFDMFVAAGATMSVGWNLAVFTLPSELYPPTERRFTGSVAREGVIAMMRITASGQVDIYTTTATSAQGLFFTGKYRVSAPTTTTNQSGSFIFNGKVYQGTSNSASNVGYDNSTSGLVAATVQAAIDQLMLKIGTLNTFATKIQKTGLIPKQNNGVNAMSGGAINVSGTNGTGIVFYVDQRVKTIRITATGAGFVCQYGSAAFTGSLPTLITTGADRGTYGVVGGGSFLDFNWSGGAGLFFVGCQGTTGGLIAVEVIDYV